LMITNLGAGISFRVNDETGDADTTPFVVDVSGSVGIGTTAPGYKLDVQTDAASSYAASFFNDGANVNRYGIRVQGGADDCSTTGTCNFIDFFDGDATASGGVRIVTGTVATYSPSDSRLKTDISDTAINGMDIINRLRVADFRRTSGGDLGPLQTGFIAQEAQEIFPAMVSPSPDGYLAVSDGLLIPVIIKGMQEQQTGISNLEFKISNELSNSNEQIAQLSLSLDGSALTIAELETDVNEQLTIIGEELDRLKAEDLALDAKIADINNQLLSLTTLQSQVDDLKAQNETILSFLSITEGKFDLLDGTLEAEGVVAGAFTVKVKPDGEARTIGKYIICPPLIEVDDAGKCAIEQVDEDKDGLDDETGNPLRDGKSEVVKTKVIKNNSKVFITPKSAVEQPLAVTTIIEGESFTVEVKNPVAESIEFDWFVVGEQVVSESVPE